jgi:hypothetical protein
MALTKYRGVLIVKAGGLYEIYLPKDKGRLSYRTDSLLDAKRFIDGEPGYPGRKTVQNAGRYSKRKHKKFMKGQGFSGSDIQYIRSKSGPRAKRTAKRSTRNPKVYDSTGKLVGKFSRKAAKIAARASGGTVGKSMLFRTKEALLNFAATHGYKVKSIRKAPR